MAPRESIECQMMGASEVVRKAKMDQFIIEHVPTTEPKPEPAERIRHTSALHHDGSVLFSVSSASAAICRNIVLALLEDSTEPKLAAHY
jgi:hypothetical protein